MIVETPASAATVQPASPPVRIDWGSERPETGHRLLLPRVRTRRRRWGPGFWIGAGLITVFLLMAALGPAVAPFSPIKVGAGPLLQPPSTTHLFGTDALGRDLFSRVLYGARIALGMAAFGVTVSAALGAGLGAGAGYYGGRLDQAVSRLMEVWLAFPGVLLAIIIVARLGPGLANTTIALGIVGVPVFFRLMRSTTLSARRACYVEAAQSVGARDQRIMLRHILPNVGSPLIVLFTMRLGILILSGSALSFIGLGAQPPQPEWGALLAAGRDYLDVAPWLALWPGLCITLTVVGLNLLGDGLRDALDPQQCWRI